MLFKENSSGSKGSFKYFIGYIHEGSSLPISLYLKLPQMNGYVKYFDNNKYINLLVWGEELLKIYNETWYKVKNLFKKEFDSEPLYDDKYIKAKIQIYNNRVYTNFQYDKIPKDNECCACLSVILVDSIIVNTCKKCYPQIFLEECKYALKKKMITNTIKEELNLNESEDEINESDEYQDIYEQL